MRLNVQVFKVKVFMQFNFSNKNNKRQHVTVKMLSYIVLQRFVTE